MRTTTVCMYVFMYPWSLRRGVAPPGEVLLLPVLVLPVFARFCFGGSIEPYGFGLRPFDWVVAEVGSHSYLLDWSVVRRVPHMVVPVSIFFYFFFIVAKFVFLSRLFFNVTTADSSLYIHESLGV